MTMLSTQGTTVRVEFGDATTAADSSGAHTISRIFPHTYGQPLAHFLRATAKVPDAQIITSHPTIRYEYNDHFIDLSVYWFLYKLVQFPQTYSK